MPVITDKFKKQVLDEILADFQDSDNVRYYAAIGRSDDWNDSDVPTVPTNDARSVRQARLSIQSAKLIEDLSFVIPRRTWVANLIYSAYDDNDVGFPENPFYVINTNNEVYVCLEQGKRQDGSSQLSTVQPTGNTTGTPFRTSDGYTWKFLYSIGALRADKFLSSAYMPVRLITSTDSDSPAEDLQQEIVQNNAVKGQILSYRITNGGTGYTSTPTVSIVGNGTGAQAYAVRAGDAIIDIKVKEDSAGNAGNSYFGVGYDYANIVISGGGGDSATARAVFATNENGIGSNPIVDLKSNGIMFNTKPNGTENDDFIIGDEIFRQVLLIRNPRVDSGSGTLLESTSAQGLRKIIHDGAGFVKSTVQRSQITGVTTGAVAVIDDTNDSDTIWYHQTETTGFTSFQVGEEVQVVGNASINGTITSLDSAEFNVFTGDLLYIDNRSAVTRSVDQTEDLKIVITI
jgi:hypothetical protein